MGASLLQRRLHDVNPDLFHVLVSTESAAQEASCMGTRYGQPLAAPFSALAWVSFRCRSVHGRQMQRCEYESYVYAAIGRCSWVHPRANCRKYRTNLRIRSKNKHSMNWEGQISLKCNSTESQPMMPVETFLSKRTLDATSTQPSVLFWFPLLLSPAMLFLTCLLLLSLLLWMFGQHVYSIHTHIGTQLHAGATPGTCLWH